MSGLYILDDAGRPAPEPDIHRWGRWRDDHRDALRVARTAVGGVIVSTVFLAMDHGWGEGPPVLWETLVFDGDLDSEMDRYTSREAAEAGHAAMVRRVEAAQKGRGDA